MNVQQLRNIPVPKMIHQHYTHKEQNTYAFSSSSLLAIQISSSNLVTSIIACCATLSDTFSSPLISSDPCSNRATTSLASSSDCGIGTVSVFAGVFPLTTIPSVVALGSVSVTSFWSLFGSCPIHCLASATCASWKVTLALTSICFMSEAVAR